MYQGNNPIAKRSQEWLAESLLEILQTKEYTKISIKDICDKADLSRQTFYQMFDSKEEVARYAVQFLKSMIFPSCSSRFDSPDEMKKAARQFASGVRENKNIILLYLKNNLQHILYDELSKTLSCMEKRLKRNSISEMDILANAFLTGAFARSLIILVEHEEITDEMFAEFIYSVLRGEYYRI